MAAKKKTNIQIEDFPIPTRTINLLKGEGILSGADFANYSKKNLQEIRGLGPGSLAELLVFLKGAGIKLRKAEPKPKKEARWPKETKEILEQVQGVVNSYVREIPLMGKLIEEFGTETMRRVTIPYGKDSVQYFFTGGKIAGWAYSYIQGFAPIRLVERPVEPVAPCLPDLEGDGGVEEALACPEPVEYQIKAKVPKTLGEFLSLRK